MGIIYNNNQKNGLIFGGTDYSKQDPLINEYKTANVIVKTIPSAATEQTSGYSTTFSFTTEPFVLYNANDVFTPLTSLPTYKIFLNYVTQQEITSLHLVYNGDGTFSWQGELNIGEVYISVKLSGEVTLSLVDENGDCFVSNISILSASSSQNATTVSYTKSTITEEIKKSDYLWATETPVFPYTIKSSISTDVIPSRYSTFATPKTFGNQVSFTTYQTIT